MTTAEIVHLLKVRYDRKAYALLFEVGNTTGFNCSGYADALAMSLWPSRGLELIGHEIKASRTDWIKEIKNPAKAEPICQHCDRWYVVAGDDKIVQTGELPVTWGLMVATATCLKVKVEAPKLDPKPITRGFLGAIMRRVVEQCASEEELKVARAEAFKKGQETTDRMKDIAVKDIAVKDLAELRKAVNDFQDASGVAISHWRVGRKIGEAVELVLRGDMEFSSRLRSVRHVASQIVQDIDVWEKETSGE